MFWPFRRSDPPQPVVDVPLADYNALQRTLGRLEAAVEALELKWYSYRDEMKKLVNRLEKRDERSQKKELALVEGEDTPQATSLRGRVLARRRHG